MTEIVLVRQTKEPIPAADKEAARRVLFSAIDGLSEQHKKSWRRLIGWFMNKAEPGEMVEIRTNRERIGVVHRKHMLMEQRVFEAQEKFEHFDPGFRDWLKVGAGFVTWHPGPKGGVFPVPKSIRYGKCEQEEFDRYHDDVVAFLRTEHAQKTLWRHLSVMQRNEMMETILQELKE